MGLDFQKTLPVRSRHNWPAAFRGLTSGRSVATVPRSDPRVHSAPLVGTRLSSTQARGAQHASPERMAAPNFTPKQILVKSRNKKIWT